MSVSERIFRALSHPLFGTAICFGAAGLSATFAGLNDWSPAIWILLASALFCAGAGGFGFGLYVLRRALLKHRPPPMPKIDLPPMMIVCQRCGAANHVFPHVGGFRADVHGSLH